MGRGVRSWLGVCTPPIHFVGAGFKPPVIASECDPVHVYMAASRRLGTLPVGGVLIGAEVGVVATVEALAQEVACLKLDVAQVGLDRDLVVVFR